MLHRVRIPRRVLAVARRPLFFNPNSNPNPGWSSALRRHASSSSYPAGAALPLGELMDDSLHSSPLPPSSPSPENLMEDEEDFDFGGPYRVILPPEPFIFGTSHIPQRSVPPHIPRPDYVFRPGGVCSSTSKSPGFRGRIKLGGDEELGVREAARLAKRVREYAGSLVKVGVTTNEIDEAVHEFIVSHSAYPSPLGYNGYPKSCCTSINNVVVHGIPDDNPLEEGDIINIDVTLYLNGFHGDTSQTFPVGEVDSQATHLIHTTNHALQGGISACGPGKPFKGIGNAIHNYLLLLRQPRSQNNQPWKYSVSSQFTGHGIGPEFHSQPWIVHSKNDEPGIMQPGHCFTIEPAIIQGDDARSWIFPDGWTASTENCARSAQAEHMVLITHDGVEVLTR